MTTVYITVTSDSVEDGIAPQVICTSLYLAEAQYKQNEFNAAGKITPTGRQLVANVLQVNVPEGKAMKTATLTTKDDAAAKMWQEYVEKNQDPYGWGCIETASKLGKNLDDGMSPADAEKAAIKGSGITGYMMGVVAQMIWSMHPRGDEFKKYFNGEFGADPDADGIVNPAIMTVGPGESVDMDLTGKDSK